MNSDRYHAHLTVPVGLDKLQGGWKRTEIVLIGQRTQTDVMLTKHFQIGKRVRSIHDIYDELRDMAHATRAIRVKLEKDNNFSPLTEHDYLECHCKIRGAGQFDDSWVRSRNPRDMDGDIPIFFWNKRVYSGDISMQILKCREDVARSGAFVVDFKIEQVVMDTNREHDAWWA